MVNYHPNFLVNFFTQSTCAIVFISYTISDYSKRDSWIICILFSLFLIYYLKTSYNASRENRENLFKGENYINLK